jgi:hypothetical protein
MTALLSYMKNSEPSNGNGALAGSLAKCGLAAHGEFTAAEQLQAEADGCIFASGPAVSPGAPAVGLFAAAEGGAGLLSAGAYKWVVTFVTAVGETLASAEIGVTLAATKQASLTAIPLGPAGAGVTARKIYRTKAAGATGTEKLVHEIADNTTTTYADNVADASLTTAIPSADTSSNYAIAQANLSAFRWHTGG